MKKRVLALLLCGLMVFSSVPTTPLADMFAISASAAQLDLSKLENTLEIIPPKSEWDVYVDTSMLEMWYDTAKDMIENPDGYTQTQVDNCVNKLRAAYLALEYHTTGIKLNKSTATAYIDQVLTLKATLTPEGAADDITWTSSNSNIATVTQNGQVTVRAYSATGVKITATSNGHSASCKITTLNQLGGVKLSQSDVTLYEGAGTTIKATAVGRDSSAKTTDEVSFTWDTSNPSVVAVSDSGYIKAKSKGTATITCTASGENNTSYTAKCTVTVNDLVPVTALQPLTITTQSGYVMTEGETATFKVSVLPADASIKKLSWKSADTSIAKVSDAKVTSSTASAKITAVKQGKVKITYSATDGSGKSGYFTVDVRPKVSSLTITEKVKVIAPDAVGKKLTVKILPTNAGNQTLSWTSSDNGVCQVDYAGYLYPKAYGVCTITGMTNDGSNLKVTCKVRVADKASSLTLNRSTLTINNGKSYTLKATVKTVGGTSYGEVKWTSSNTKVASVSQSGVVKGKYPGKATITATTLDGTKKTAVCTVTVNQPLTSISVTAKKSVPVGKTRQLSVTYTPSYATNKEVTWTSSNTSIATVSSTGLVYGKKAGTATIYCISNDGGYSDSCTVTVYVPATGISISKSAVSMWAGKTYTLSAVVSPNSATYKTVKWTSSNKKVATVSSKGVVTAVAGGKCVITASSAEGGHKATCTVTVKQKVTGVKLAVSTANLYVGQTYTLKASVVPSTASNKTVYYKSANTSVVTVASDGKLTAKAPGSTTVTVTTADGSYKASCTVKVTKKVSVTGIKLDTTSKSIYKGKTYTIVATVSPSNASDKGIYWKSSDTKIATVTSKGIVKGISSGTAVITATTRDGRFSKQCKITVYQPVTSVRLNASSVSLAKGSSKTLRATVYPSDATNKSVKWSTSNSSVVTVSQNGVVTAKGAGTATVTVKTVNGGYVASCNFSVYVPVTGIKLNASSLTMAKNTERLLRAVVTPSNATTTDVTWTSSNTTVATVNEAGVVTAKQKGTTKISATSSDGKMTASCIVTVIQQVTQVNLSATSVTLDVGKTKTVTATVQPYTATYKSVTWKSSDKSVATVTSKGVIKAVKAGVATITATSTDKYASATCKVTVTQPATGIVLNYAKAVVRVGGTRVLKATVIPTNATNASITWRSSDEDIATVDQNGVVTGKAKGTVYIYATNSAGKSEKCLISVFKSVRGVTLNKTSMTLKVGGYSTITPTIIPSDAGYKTVKWTSSNNDVATVSSKGRVTAKSAGYAKITVTTTDGKKTAVCEVLVVQPVTGVKLSKTSATLATGKTITLKATVLPSNASDKGLTWSSSNKNVAKVSSKGVVTGVNKGKATITVKTKDGGFTSKCVVTVIKKVSGVTLNKSSATLYIGKTLTLKASVNPSDATNTKVYWYSGDKNTATVDQNGIVTPVKVGKVTIGVRTNDGGFKDYCTVNVKKAVASFSINKSSLSLKVGEYFRFTSKVLPADATDKTIKWTSSDTSVLAISQTGLIKAKKRGTATVTATTHNGLVAKCTVTVIQDVKGVELDKTALTLYTGKTSQLSCSVLPSDANNKNVTWTSSDKTVATVSSKGLVTAVKAGDATITVKTKDGGFTAQCEVTVKQKVTSIKLDKASLTLAVGEYHTFKATVGPSDATDKTVTWSSSDTSVLAISKTGLVKAKSKGTATVTATSSSGLSAKCTVTVIQQVTGVEISKSAVSLYTGRTYALSATVLPENANNKDVTWTSSDKAVATVSSSGVITAVKAGTATITVETKDGGFTAECEVTVKQYAESIKLNKTSLSLRESKTYTLTATVLPEDTTNKSVTWESSDEDVVTVTQDGVVEGLKKGTATVTVTASNGVSAKCTVKVIRSVTGVEISKNSVSLYTGRTYALSATVLPADADNLNVTWSSSDENIATVTQDGVITGVKAGNATITVKTEDGGFTAQCEVTVKQHATSVVLSKTSLSLREGKTYTLAATVLPEDTTDKSITWESSDENILTVTQDGVVEGIKKGTATVTVTASSGVSAKCTVKVIRSVTGVELNKNAITVYTGQKETLVCNVLPEDADNRDVTWTSADEKIAKVAEDGTVTGVKAGSTTVTVKTKDGEFTAQCEVTVKQHVESVTLSKSEITLRRGEETDLSVTVYPFEATNKNYTFKISDETVATVTQQGHIVAVKAGEAVITVTTEDESKTAECKVTVVEPVTSVTLSENEKTCFVGDTLALSATVKPADATDKSVSWISSDTDVATVSEKGVVTFKKSGSVTVTVKTNDGGFTDECEITVLQKAQSVKLNKDKLSMIVGEGYTLKATVLPEDCYNKNVTWKSSESSVATVDEKGVVEAVNPGKAVITVTSEDGQFTAECNVTVIQPVAGVTLSENELIMYTGDTHTLTANIVPANASDKTVTWISTDTAVATVVDGVVEAKGTGTTTVFVRTNDGSFVDKCDVRVVVPVSSVTAEKDKYIIKENEEEKINVTVLPENAYNKNVTFQSSDENIVKVDSKGVLTAVSKGTATVTVKSADNGQISTSVQVQVVRPVASVSLDKTKHTMDVGETLTLKASVLPADADNLKVSWASSDKAVATVTSKGVVTAVGPGTANIRVTTADGGFTAMCSLTVNRKAESVVFDKQEYTVDTGNTALISATVLPEDTSFKQLQWSSSDEKIAKVDENGVVTGIKAGSTTITATTVYGGITGTVKIKVTQQPEEIQVNAEKTVLWVGDTVTATVTVLPEDTTDKTVTWNSSNEEVVKVVDGIITAVGAGETTVSATSANGKVKGDITVEVRQQVTELNLNYTSKATQAGGSFNLTATVLPENAYDKTVTWESSDEEVATVDENGKVTAHKSGSAVITAKSHNGKVASQCRVRVIKLVELIELNQTSLTVEKGTEFNLVATVLPEDATEKAVTWSSSDENVLTVDNNGKVKTLAGGVATVTATTSTEGVKAECVVNVEVSSASITLNKAEETLYCGETLSLSVTVLPEDATNKKVSFESSDEAVATVDENGVVTAKEKGEVTITATTYDTGLKASCKIKILKHTQSVDITQNSVTVEKNGTYSLTYKVLPEDASDKSVKWSSSDESVATVEDGVISAKSVGSANIIVQAVDGGFRDICNVKVVQYPESITLNETQVTLYEGNTQKLEASFAPSDTTQKALSWKSDDESVAKVDNNGVVTAVALGNTVITVTGEKGVSAKCNVTVKKAVESISLNKIEASCFAGETLTLTATVLPENASDRTVTWSTSDKTVATVDESGVVTAIKKGEATITATTNQGGKSVSCLVTVLQKAQSVTLDKDAATVKQGESITLTATVLPDNTDNKSVIWKSSNEAVAIVDENGKVSALGVGTAEITATSSENGSAKATCTITVTKGVTGVRFEKNEYEAYVSDCFKLGWIIEPSDATNKNVTFNSSDDKVAVVDAEGNITAKGRGTAIITVKTADGGYMAMCYIKVKQAVTSVTLDKTEITLEKNGTATLTAAVAPSDASDKTLIWSSSDEEVATVSDGVVTAGTKSGTAVITVKSKDNEEAAAQCVVNVTEPATSVTLSKTQVYLRKGESTDITATVYPENATDKSVTWSVMDSGVATVKNGKITAVASGKTYVIVTTKDGGHTAMCVVNVYRELESFTLSAAATLKNGASTQLTVKATPSYHDEKFTYSSSDEKVITVDSTGLITAHSAGKATITATSTISGKTATCEVTVTQSVGSITLELDTFTGAYTGYTHKMEYQILPENATDKSVTWSSSDESIATVDSEGNITYHKAGEVIITVTSNDMGYKDSCKVTVKQAPESIEMDIPAITLKKDGTITLTHTLLPDNSFNKTVVWESDTPSVATVDQNGKVTAVSSGTAKIYVKAWNGVSAYCEVTVS